MASRELMKRLETLESSRGITAQSITLEGVTCPHEAARRYMALMNTPAVVTSMDWTQRDPKEADRVYREVMQ